MEEYKSIDPKLSEVEIFYQILKKSGQPMNFREIMPLVLEIKGLSGEDPQLMASVHTSINLDSRFVHAGQGNWGLREWSQGKVVRRNISFAASGRTIPFRRRTLQDEIDYEESDLTEKYITADEDDEDDIWND